MLGILTGFVEELREVGIPVPQAIKRISFGVTAMLGIGVFLLELDPPDLLIFLNLFAFGGLEAAFIWPVVLGLYWKWGNKYGAIASMITGIGTYVALHFYNQEYGNLLGVHTVTFPVLLSLVAFIAFSLLIGRKAYDYAGEIFTIKLTGRKMNIYSKPERRHDWIEAMESIHDPDRRHDRLGI